MDGIHDLGGMQGFGPVVREENEPPFHADWEAVVVAIMHATGGRGSNLLNIDEFRYGIERMDPAHYLASSYYEHWLDGISRVLSEKGAITTAALDARTDYFLAHPDAPASAPLSGPPPPVAKPTQQLAPTSERALAAPARYAPGDTVRTRNTHPHGHTRLARYARDKRGVIHAVHGGHVFPDAHAHGLGEQPQPLYSVCFDAQTLWGDSAEPNQRVYIDLWESYLLPG